MGIKKILEERKEKQYQKKLKIVADFAFENACKKNDQKLACEYIKKYSELDKEKTEIVSHIVVQSWQDKESFDVAKKFAEEHPQLLGEFDDSVKNKIENHSLKTETSIHIIPYVYNKGWDAEFDMLQEKVKMQCVKDIETFISYIEKLDQIHLNITDDMIYKYLVDVANIDETWQNGYSVFSLERLIEHSGNADLNKVVSNIVDLSREAQNKGMMESIFFLYIDRMLYDLCCGNGSKFIDKNTCDLVVDWLMNDVDMQHFCETAYGLVKAGCIEDPKTLETFVLKAGKHYTKEVCKMAIVAANTPGVDATEIENMVLEKGDFYQNYDYAMRVKSADKQAHLDVMMQRIPSVHLEKVGYWEAYWQVERAQDINFKIYGELPDGEISEAAVARERAYMQERAMSDYNSKLNEIHKAISKLSVAIENDKKGKRAGKTRLRNY